MTSTGQPVGFDPNARGTAYVPGLKVKTTPSRGLTMRIRGWKTDRVHILLSLGEVRYFYTLEWSDCVLDIREQFALPLDETLAIAEAIGVKHPTKPRTNVPAVMTTDFVLTVLTEGQTVDVARSYKMRADTEAQRTLEKLEIERLYWVNHQVDWRLVTECEVSEPLARNVEWVHPYRSCLGLPVPAHDIPALSKGILESAAAMEQLPVARVARALDDQIGLKLGTSLSVVRHCIANKLWSVNMSRPVDPTRTSFAELLHGCPSRGVQYSSH